ncbi:MAG: hypothetical protein EOO56_13955 [Hymenobacter sp.]|nr:MAG: hypothetical protein EOO56_13955 [Hymenobacter sp.]
MGFVLLLLLVIFGPPLLLVLLSVRFGQLSQLADLTGPARTRRFIWLAVLASGMTGSLYLLLCVLSAEIPGAHAAAKSSFPWLHEHPLTPVVLVSLAVTLLLLCTRTRRPAGLSFGVGALLVLGGLGTHWFFTDHQEDVKRETFYQLRQVDIAYRDTGAQRAARDSFELQAARCYHKDLLDKEPTFPGGDRALDAQVQALMRPTAPRPPVNTYVLVQGIVEPTGRVTFPHVIEGLGPGFDEEAVRIVRHLPLFEPGILRATAEREQQPVAVHKQIYVSFYY